MKNQTWKITFKDGSVHKVSNDVIGRYTISNRGKIEKMELI